ncbi:MAG TPA: GtrA family protein [Anaerolinea sp.]|nr:GtrA family protein [Anaerolinea sp.]
MIITNRQERTRFLRFALVGAIGAVVDFGTFNLLTQLTAITAVVASMISFSAAVTSNFIWNRFWTYPDSRSKSVMKQVVQFFIVNLIGLAIRTPLFATLEKILVSNLERLLKPGFPFPPTFVGHNISLAVAVLVVMMWNFFANRFWTYNDVS